MTPLQQALNHPTWQSHAVGDTYSMDGVEGWKIAYYPIFEDGKTGEQYDRPRAVVERPATFKGVQGIDFREVPIEFLDPAQPPKPR